MTARICRAGGAVSKWPNRSQFLCVGSFMIVRTRLRQRLSVTAYQIEKGMRGIDNDGPGWLGGRIVDQLAAQLRWQLFGRAMFGLVLGRQCRDHRSPVPGQFRRNRRGRTQSRQGCWRERQVPLPPEPKVFCEEDLSGARHRILITGPDWGDCAGIVNSEL
jgi:hypothetical protein